MNIRQVEKEIINKLLSAGIEQNEAKIEAEMLLKHFGKFSDVDLLLKERDELEISLVDEIIGKAALRAATRKPIQQIIGYAQFMGENFIVNEHVLIPRDETEILVRKAVEILDANGQRCKDAKDFNVLDIGAGSGCISCMIAKLSEVKVLGVDISQPAIEIAQKNVVKLNLGQQVGLRVSDLFSKINNGEKFDLIISNPPYIPKNQSENLQTELKYEPQNALFANDIEGIEFYDKIIKQSPDFLNKAGCLMFELGIKQADAVQKLMKNAGFNDIEIEKDFAGIERVIWGKI